jgi:hypothetical protein
MLYGWMDNAAFSFFFVFLTWNRILEEGLYEGCLLWLSIRLFFRKVVQNMMVF